MLEKRMLNLSPYTDYCLNSPCGFNFVCTNTKSGPKCECADDEGQRMLDKGGSCVTNGNLQEVKEEKEGEVFETRS